MTNYKELQAHFLTIGGGDKAIPVSVLLDLVSRRAMLLSQEACTPKLEAIDTEFVRGQYHELNLFLRVLRNERPGCQDGNQ